MTDLTKSRSLFLFDGLCGFCNGTVRWVLKRDKQDSFRFAPLQSSLAETLLRKHGVVSATELQDTSAYLLVAFDTPEEKLLCMSDVTVYALLQLGGLWHVLGRVLQSVPKPIRDSAYRLVARNRYRFAGRSSTCEIPSPAIRAKFIA